jgi:hypothetical protein
MVVVGRPEANMKIGRPRQSLECNIELDLEEIQFDGVGWIHLAQDVGNWQAV